MKFPLIRKSLLNAARARLARGFIKNAARARLAKGCAQLYIRP